MSWWVWFLVIIIVAWIVGLNRDLDRYKARVKELEEKYDKLWDERDSYKRLYEDYEYKANLFHDLYLKKLEEEQDKDKKAKKSVKKSWKSKK